MIDTDKYEGHTGPWKLNKPDELGDYTIQDKTGTYRGRFYSRFKVEDAQLIADAPLLLAEVKRLTEFRNRVLAAFVEMPRNRRSLTYLLNELGYLNHYSRADYLEGLHPHALGLFELKDEWMEKAKQYLEDDEE